MITLSVACSLGSPARYVTATCPRGEALRIHVSVSSGNAAVDLSDYTVLLGWDTEPRSVPRPEPIRLTGDSTGAVDFDIDTTELNDDTYAYDVWIEHTETLALQMLAKKSFVWLTGAVSLVVTAAYYYGVGAASLNAAALALLPSVQSATPVRSSIIMSPSAQKCYFVGPASHANYGVYMLPAGFEVPMLADRTVTVAGVSCRVKETEDLMTWTDLEFETRLT